jgi:hypothetical protein
VGQGEFATSPEKARFIGAFLHWKNSIYRSGSAKNNHCGKRPDDLEMDLAFRSSRIGG